MKKIDILENININVKHEIKEYRNDEILYYEGDELNRVGIVLNGYVSIYNTTLDGFSYEINRIEKGNIFGNAIAFLDNKKVPSSIKVIKNSKILFINFEDFKLLLLNNKEFLFNYLKYESYRNSYLQYKVKLLGQPSLREKIIFYLEEEMKKQNKKIVTLNMTKEKLSLVLSTNRPSLSRELIRMKNDGLIDYNKYEIICKF